MAELPETTLAQQIEAADREIRMRQRVYARRVAQGQMNQAEADHEIACMTAIARTLREVRKARSGQLQLELAETSRLDALCAKVRDCAEVVSAVAIATRNDTLMDISRRLRAAAGA